MNKSWSSVEKVRWRDQLRNIDSKHLYLSATVFLTLDEKNEKKTQTFPWKLSHRQLIVHKFPNWFCLYFYCAHVSFILHRTTAHNAENRWTNLFHMSVKLFCWTKLRRKTSLQLYFWLWPLNSQDSLLIS